MKKSIVSGLILIFALFFATQALAATTFLARFNNNGGIFDADFARGRASGEAGGNPSFTISGSTYKYGAGALNASLTSDPAAYLRYQDARANLGIDANTGSGTVEMWVRPNWAGSASDQHFFLEVHKASTNYYLKRLSLFAENGKLKGSMAFDVDWHFKEVQADISTWQANSWHHIALTWSGLDGKAETPIVITLYIDGNRAGITQAGENDSFLGLTDTWDITVGNKRDLTRPADAYLDDLRFANECLYSGDQYQVPENEATIIQGVITADMLPLNGALVELRTTSGDLIDSQTTLNEGKYAFVVFKADTYRVKVTKAGYTGQEKEVQVAGGTTLLPFDLMSQGFRTTFVANYNKLNGFNADYALGTKTGEVVKGNAALGISTSTYKYGDGSLNASVTPNPGAYLRYGDAGANLGMDGNNGSGTVEMWIRPNWAGTDSGKHYFLEISKDTAARQKLLLWAENGQLHGDLFFDIEYHFKGVTANISAWPADSWHHVALTWSGLDGKADTPFAIALYIDGNRVGITQSGENDSFLGLTNAWEIYVGIDRELKYPADAYLDGLRFGSGCLYTDTSYPVPSGEVVVVARGRITGQITCENVGVSQATVRLFEHDSDSQVVVAVTESDTNGFYDFTGIPVGSYKLVVQKAGYKEATQEPVNVAFNQTITVDLALVNTESISGMVMDAQNIPLAGAMVFLNETLQYTNSSGQFQFTAVPGSYTLTVIKKGFRMQSKQIVLTLGTPFHEELRLETSSDQEPPEKIAPDTVTIQTEQPLILTLSWLAPAAASDGSLAALFLVYRGESAETPLEQQQLVGACVAPDFAATPGSVFNLTDTGITTAKPYFYTIVVVDQSGNLALSAAVRGTPLAPPIPQGLGVTGGELQIDKLPVLYWQRVADAVGYKLEIARDDKFSHPLSLHVEATEDEVVSYMVNKDLGLTDGTWYWRVYALFARHIESEPSSTARFILVNPYAENVLPIPYLQVAPQAFYPRRMSEPLRITYIAATDLYVTIEVFDLKGRLVKTIQKEVLVPGITPSNSTVETQEWDGRDERGRLASNGLYLIRISFRQPGKSGINHVVKKVLMFL